MHEAFPGMYFEDLGDQAPSQSFCLRMATATPRFSFDWDNGVSFLMTSEDGSQQYGRPSYLDSPASGPIRRPAVRLI